MLGCRLEAVSLSGLSGRPSEAGSSSHVNGRSPPASIRATSHPALQVRRPPSSSNTVMSAIGAFSARAATRATRSKAGSLSLSFISTHWKPAIGCSDLLGARARRHDPPPFSHELLDVRHAGDEIFEFGVEQEGDEEVEQEPALLLPDL